MMEYLTPEIIQLVIAVIGLLGALTGYIRLRTKIEKNVADAKHRETQIKATALAREAELKEKAELIQQNAQSIVNKMATSLQSQITIMQDKYDELQGKYTTLITDHASALAQMNAATVKLTEAQKQLEAVQQKLKESEQARTDLLNTVNELEKTIELQEERILALETQMELEKQLRGKAEQAANDARLLLAAQAENCDNGNEVSVGSPDNAASKQKVIPQGSEA